MLFWLRTYLFASVITVIYRAWSLFWRIEKKGAELPQGPIIGAHFHGDELLLVRAYIGSGMGVMTSRSKDGEMMGKILKWFGFRIVRGSSTRGGAGGLKGMLTILTQEKRDVSLAVDGPRGPIYEVKKGVIKLAQETGFPIVPGAASASLSFIFKNAWNRCYLPYPFSRCVIFYGDPIWVPLDLTESEFEIVRLKVQEDLLKLKAQAEAYFTQGVPQKLSAEPL